MKRTKTTNTGTVILLIICILVLVFLLSVIGYVAVQVFSDDKPAESETEVVSSQVISDTEFVVSEITNEPEEYTNLLLVNGLNPLPEDYDYTGNLMTVDPKYLNGYNNEINKDIAPYLLKMVEDAWKDGIEIFIRSPYRSLNDQKILFENQVSKHTAKGLDRETAESKAATVVARPKTSEHHTGLAVDFNIADDVFEDTEAYTWLLKNAEDYGFILRYKAEKQDITGVIYEPWHWRYVGKTHAKRINELNMCLEEYVEYLRENSGSQK